MKAQRIIKNFLKSRHFKEIFDKNILGSNLEREIENNYKEKMERLNNRQSSIITSYTINNANLGKRGRIYKAILDNLYWLYNAINDRKFKKTKNLKRIKTYNIEDKFHDNSHDIILEIFLDDLYETFEEVEYKPNLQTIIEIFTKKYRQKRKKHLYEIDTYFQKKYVENNRIINLESIIEVKSSHKDTRAKEAISQAFKNPLLIESIEAFSKYLEIPFYKYSLLKPKPDLMVASLNPKNNNQLKIVEEYLDKIEEKTTLNYKPKLDLNLSFVSYSRGLKQLYEFLKEKGYI